MTLCLILLKFFSEIDAVCAEIEDRIASCTKRYCEREPEIYVQNAQFLKELVFAEGYPTLRKIVRCQFYLHAVARY